MSKHMGKIYVISAPSGTGKSTVIAEVLRQSSNSKFSVSRTGAESKLCKPLLHSFEGFLFAENIENLSLIHI